MAFRLNAVAAPLACGLAALMLAACSARPDLYATPAPQTEQVHRIAYRSVALRDVSLPTYAASQDIPVADASGRIRTDDQNLWADEADRAVTLSLVRALSTVTGARVASDPWPFVNRPDVTVEVRFEEFLAHGGDGANGGGNLFSMRGSYYVAPEPGLGQDRSRSFEISAPYSTAEGYQAIADARARALGQLAEKIAAEGLR